MPAQRITLRHVARPRQAKRGRDILWLCNSLGFDHGRDVDHMTFRILDTLLSDLRNQELVSSEQLAEQLRVSAGRINHHVRNLVDSGFLYREKKRIALRGGSVRVAIAELRRDANRMFDDLEEMAQVIDKRRGLL